MNRRRDLLVANLASLLVLVVVLLLGWWQEAAFGLAVLLLMDLFVVLRGRQARFDRERGGDDDSSASGEGVEDD